MSQLYQDQPSLLKPLYAALSNNMTRISIANATAAEGNNDSDYLAVSTDGRYVAFLSAASNLITGDTNNAYDIFVRDTTDLTTTLVSRDANDVLSNNHAYKPALSGDGNFVAFQSVASNLVTGDTNNNVDIFVKNTTTKVVERVSTSSTLLQSNNDSASPALSSDGRYVAFSSKATNLVTGDTNSVEDVFVKDRNTGTTTRVSIAADGTTQGNGISSNPSVSSDGRYVAFLSAADNLVASDTNGMVDLFVKDTQTGAIQRVSIATDGTQGNNHTTSGMISGNGNFVVFSSTASNLVAGDTNNQSDIFVRNLLNNTTTRVSTDSSGVQATGSHDYQPAISNDGRYVVFSSTASNLVAGDTNNQSDIFIKELATGAIQRVSMSAAGAQSNGPSLISTISGDGHYVVLSSTATNLVATDTNAKTDVFRADNILYNNKPVVNIANAQVTEGNTGTKNLDFTISLTSAAQDPITMDYTTANGSATAGVDYTAQTNTVTFNAGESSKTISIPIICDTTVESDETFQVTLSNLSGTASFSGGGSSLAATGTILNDDGVTLPTISISSPSITEGNASTKNLDFTVTLSAAAAGTIGVSYTTQNGTATTLDQDYTAQTNTLTFNPGETSKTISIPIIGDTTIELDETFQVVLSSITGAATFAGGGATLAGTGTITNDDGNLTVSIANVQTTEGDTGTKTLDFTVTLSAPAPASVSMNYATSDGTATIANNDYTSTTGSLTFSAGQSTKTISVPIVGDTTHEANETFQVTLSSLTGSNVVFSNGNATLAATGTIQNDDNNIVSVNTPAVVEGNTGTANLTFTVSLSAPATAPISMSYTTQDGTGTLANNDYTATNGTLNFAVGESSKTITVPVVGDINIEPNETVGLVLSNLTGTNVAFSNGNATLSTTGTITNDDNTGNVMSITSVETLEGNSGTKILRFTVTLSVAPDGPLDVDYVLSNGTATADSDYTNIAGTLSFYDNSTPGLTLKHTAQRIDVPIIGDLVVESDETFQVTLSNLVGTNVAFSNGGTTLSATGTILNDDGSANNALLFVGETNALNVIETPKVYGASAGNETVKIYDSANAIVDQNIERVELYGNLAQYSFQVQGNQVSVYNSTNTKIATVGIQGDGDGTTFVFADGKASLLVTGLNQATLGGQNISSVTPTAFTTGALGANFSTAEKSTVGTVTTSVTKENLGFLTTGSTLTALDTAKIFGTLGTETLKIAGAPNLVSDQNIERIEFDGPLTNYGFSITGNIASIYQLDSNKNLSSLVVKTAVQDDADGTLLVFSDGSTSLKLTGLSQATLGGTAFTNATPLVVANSSSLGSNFNTGTTSSVGNTPQSVSITTGNATPFNASLSNTTFNMTSGTYTYNIEKFNTGDKLAFPAGTAISVTNNNASDGVVDISGTTPDGKWISVHLTSIYPSQDANILGVNSFNTVFGASSLT